MPVINDKHPVREYCVSMDYGTMNAFAAILWGKIGEIWYALRNYYYSGRDKGIQKTDEQYANEIDGWLADIEGRLECIIDPSAASFIALLNKRERFKVHKADNAVLDGIRETANALDNGYIKILDINPYTLEFSLNCINGLKEGYIKRIIMGETNY